MISAILVLVGFLAMLAMGYGALQIFAGGMSDAPMEGREAANAGLTMFVSGGVVLLLVIGAGVYRWHRGY